MMRHKVDYKIGKCKGCGAKNVPIYTALGLCADCHSRNFKQAQRDGRMKNRFIG